ncbi:hypothetical protein CLOP_g22363 [Closterium sp. NIES-67]|nr:hypothetical protein CLOP_g22363 [Closterium sp. NIES-67]
MQSRTHIDDLPNDVLARILWHYGQIAPPKSNSDVFWDPDSLNPNFRSRSISASYSDDKYNRQEKKKEIPLEDTRMEKTPLEAPPASANAHRIFRLASVCRRWRRVSHRYVSTLLIGENLVVSRRDLANAVASFANLTHLHLCDGSVETLDDAFLAHLATSCGPKLTILHVGSGSAPAIAYVGRKDEHPITDVGLDLFFQQCTQLEQLSLFCLHGDVDLPSSFYRLSNLHTLALTNAATLDAPEFPNLTSLTNLHIVASKVTYKQLANLARLPSITRLSLSDDTYSHPGGFGWAGLDISLLPSLRSLKFDQFFPAKGTFTRLERLDILESFASYIIPDEIGNLLPCLRELSIRRCSRLTHLPETLTSLSRLETLRVSTCRLLSSLPENLGHLRALKTLVLEGLAALEDLPDSICELSSLESFLLIECPEIPELPTEFSRLTALKTLSLENLELESLPENIGELPNLQTIFLGGRYLSAEISPSFTQLTSLTRLELHGCMIQELPQDLGNLGNLRELHIRSCRLLREIPESLIRLTSLETLIIADEDKDLSGFLLIPRSLDNLGRLKRLEVSGWGYPSEPSECLPPSLEVLRLRGRSYQATDIARVALLPNLRSLSLKPVAAGTRLAGGGLAGESLAGGSLAGTSLAGSSLVGGSLVRSSLDGRCLAWESLAGESLAGESLAGESLAGESLAGESLAGESLAGESLAGESLAGESLAGESLAGESLTGESLAGESIAGESIAGESIAGDSLVGTSLAGGRIFPCLQHLELTLQDDAVEIPLSLELLPLLHTLSIRGAAGLRRLPGNLGSTLQHLRQLQLENAGELESLPESITQLQQLQQLRIENVGKLESLPESVTQLQQLTSLEVSEAPKLASLPKGIGALSRLRELTLNECPGVEYLPASLTQLACLTHLSLLNSSIRFLPGGFIQLTQLRSLSLHGCERLEAFPESFTALTMLRVLDVTKCAHLLEGDGVIKTLKAREVFRVYGLRIHGLH